ncbi:MAG: hypothetical protein DHS20C17_19700 [Cyclobacteriaceae bacterium]|nr:MAG: hypothetical protein DHS20C17_19700 [Cyclobacteriaceae bacterium]
MKEVKIINWLKRLLFAAVIGITSFNANAQGLEIGGGLGTMYATGDVTRGMELGELGLAGQLFIRYNLSNVVSVRGTGLIGGISGDDETNPIDPFAEKRDFSFFRTNYEASAVIEYNFLDYKERNSIINFSPYFFIGGGLSATSNKNSEEDYRRIQPVIPFGVGVKYRLTKQWNLEFEFGARKTFYDGLDKLSGVPNPNKLQPRYGNELDNDWYYFAGISVSYTFYSIPCPFNSY